jgi:adenylate cyclase
MNNAKRLKKILTATAVAVSVFLIILAIHYSRILIIAELKSLDHRFQRYADPASAGKDLVLVAIDESSLETFGRWPWPRDRHGFMVHYLKQAGARAIVFDVLFLEPDEAAEEFDAMFAEQIRAAGNVFLPFLFLAEPVSSLPQALLAKATIPVTVVEAKDPLTKNDDQHAKFPIPSLTEGAARIGYINLSSDSDGVTRRIPLLIRNDDSPFAFTHLVSAVATGLLKTEGAQLTSRYLTLGSAIIPVTSHGNMVIDWHGPLKGTYPVYPAGAVLKAFTEMQQGVSPSLDPALFKDKIVFIAGTAAGTYDLRVTPMSPYTPGVLIHMTALDNILRGRYMQAAPFWVFVATTLALCLLTAWAFMLISNQVLKFGAIIALAAGYYGLVVHAFTAHGLWVELALPEGALAATFALAATVEYLTEGRQRRQLRAAFDKYMAPEVVDEIMRHPDIKLGGEKKEVTLLFSDIAGFTTVSEQLSPEALVELLNEYLSAMTDIIRRHRGNVNKYLGDGIMALFGAPLGEPTHATLACYAALDSQEALARLRADWKARGHKELHARIGINTGASVVGNMGSQARMEYTVMGDSVNLASRLEGANKYYDTLILLGPHTYELAAPDIEAREVDLLRVKGKHEPVVVYELLARKGALDAGKQEVVAIYLRGLTSYKARDFERASRDFEAALKLDPLDGPSKVYVKRSQEFLVHPPPPDWDGVYELRSK